MKKLISLCICLILTFSLIPTQAKADAQAENPDWMTAYEKILDGWKEYSSEDLRESSFSQPRDLLYLVYDVDKDGTPELLIKSGWGESDLHGALYTFRHGEVYHCADLSLGHTSFYTDPGENGIILMNAHMWYARTVRISLTERGYEEELLYNDDVNARVQENPEEKHWYIDPGEVIPGSTELTLCRGDLTLPMRRYEEISRILDGEKLPTAADAQFPDSDPDFFNNLISNNGEVFAAAVSDLVNSPGRIGFQDLLGKDVTQDHMKGDLNVRSYSLADLNGDGQLECIISAGSDSSGDDIVIALSEQDGAVYAYLIPSYLVDNEDNDYELDDAGNFIVYSEYEFLPDDCYRLIFDAEEAFLLRLLY